MSETLDLQKQKGAGRPEYTDKQYELWLEELRPYLENGNKLYKACNRAGIPQHYHSVLEKYNSNDWFSLKVDAYREEPGEIINDTYVTLVRGIADRVKRNEELSDNQVKILEHFSKNHRTAQPFFVNRTEMGEGKTEDVGKIIERPAINYVIPKENKDPNKSPGDNVSADSETTPSVAKVDG